MLETVQITLLPSEIERFWSYVDIRSADDCWEWQGARSARGYGIFSAYGATQRTYRAHRVASAIAHGDTHKIILHKCNNPSCCNPKHLSPGTLSENTQQAIREGRWNPPRGERNGNAKLTANDVCTIRRLRDRGIPCKELAVRFGVSAKHISRVSSSKRWSHISPHNESLTTQQGTRHHDDHDRHNPNRRTDRTP